MAARKAKALYASAIGIMARRRPALVDWWCRDVVVMPGFGWPISVARMPGGVSGSFSMLRGDTYVPDALLDGTHPSSPLYFAHGARKTYSILRYDESSADADARSLRVAAGAMRSALARISDLWHAGMLPEHATALIGAYAGDDIIFDGMPRTPMTVALMHVLAMLTYGHARVPTLDEGRAAIRSLPFPAPSTHASVVTLVDSIVPSAYRGLSKFAREVGPEAVRRRWEAEEEERGRRKRARYDDVVAP